jgi:hypothetical protein
MHATQGLRSARPISWEIHRATWRGLIEFRGGATNYVSAGGISWRSCHEILRPATVQHPYCLRIHRVAHRYSPVFGQTNELAITFEPSARAPGLRAAPGGVTSLVPSVRMISVPDGLMLLTWPSILFSSPGIGGCELAGGGFWLAGGGVCIWPIASVTRTTEAISTIAKSTLNLPTLEPPLRSWLVLDVPLRNTARGPAAAKHLPIHLARRLSTMRVAR